MSIAAYVEKCTETEEGLWIELCGMQTAGGYYEPPGQPRLLVLDPTYVPEVGTVLWGGANSILLESKPQREYERISYVRLREKLHK